MSDDDLRELERRALESRSEADRDALLRALERLGDPARLLHWRWRFGLISRRRLQLAGLAGYPPASQALPAEARIPPPAGLREWADELGRFGHRMAVRAGLAAALEVARVEAEAGPLPSRVEACLSAAEAWLEAPSEALHEAALDLSYGEPEWATLTCRAVTMPPGFTRRRGGTVLEGWEDPHVSGILRAAEALTPEAVRAAVEAALQRYALAPEFDAEWVLEEEGELYDAATYGQLQRLNELLAEGISPDARSPTNPRDRALISALSRRRTATAERLVAAGASLGETPQERQRLGTLAERAGSRPILEALLASGAELTLGAAVVLEDREGLRRLVPEADREARQDAAILALTKGDPEALRSLLSPGGLAVENLLYEALNMEDPAVAEALISAGEPSTEALRDFIALLVARPHAASAPIVAAMRAALAARGEPEA